MTPEQTVFLRENLLMQLASARPLGLLVPRLSQGARMGGFYLSDAELEAQLAVLQKKGLVQTQVDPIAITMPPHWLITEAGLKELDSRGY